MKSDRDDRYDQVVLPLIALAPRLETLIHDVLADVHVKPHSVVARVKSRESVDGKLVAKADRYTDVGDITDLLGVRIVTYFADEVDLVARQIVQQFEVDEQNSVDKRSNLAADRFGYLSLHYVAELGQGRCSFAEYRKFSGVKFEIQIRSILQHAWAEIEHDLGYKSEGTVPRTFRRRFSRLAGLLELADEEFIALMQSRDRYERDVHETANSELVELGLDQVTLAAAYESIPIFLQLDESIATIMEFPLGEVSPKYLERRASGLRALGVERLEDVVSLITARFDYIAELCRQFLRVPTNDERPVDKPVPRGIGLFYLEYVLAANGNANTYRTWRGQWPRSTPRLERLQSLSAAVAAKVGP